MLVLHVPDALKHPSPDSITQILRRGLRVDVPQIHRAVEALHTPLTASTDTGGRVWCEGRERARKGVRRRGRQRTRRLCNKRLRSGDLSRLRRGLLRLGDVRTAVLAVVDALTCPRGLGRECVHNLYYAFCKKGLQEK